MRHHPKLATLTLALTMLGVLAVASACAQQGTQPGSGSAASPSSGVAAPSAPSSDTSGNAGSDICKTQLNVVAADANKTLCVAVGGTVTVDLGPGATSAAKPFDVSGDSLKAGAAEGTYSAVSTGTAVITAERRNCPKPSPGSGMVACNSIQLWKVTINVK
jgi:ABC-type Fe3+-hydroxamate transport system substrate-binding protein